jgi:hypothetical protein
MYSQANASFIAKTKGLARKRVARRAWFFMVITFGSSILK